MIGLGSSIAKPGKIGKRIVRDGLVLKHDYDVGAVQPVSTGAADINADGAANEYIDVGTIAISTGDVSVSAWVYVTTFTAYAPIFSNRESGGSGLGIELRTSGDGFELNYDHGSSSISSTSTAKNTNQWYHVCGVLDRSGNQYLYVDGVQTDPKSINATDVTHTTTARIGTSGSGGTDFSGYVCNVGYWNAALTQAQVKSIMHKDYASLSSSEKTNLVSWWNLDSKISEDYAATSEDDDDPSTISDLTLDNHDTTFTEVSVANSDFTSGSGTTVTPWTNENSQWTRVDDTVVSGTTSKLLQQNVLTVNIAHKVIVRAKNTTTDSASVLRVYIGANNWAEYNLTNDFAEYTFHGLQSDDVTLYLYNASSTNVTVDWVKVYKYDGNVGILL